MKYTKIYIPFATKTDIIDNVVEACIVEDKNGMSYVDYALKDFFTNKFLLETLKKFKVEEAQFINFPEGEELKVYDELCESGKMDELLALLDDRDYFFITDKIEQQLESNLKQKNSLEGILSKGITSLLSKLDEYLSPVAIEKLSENLGALDANKVKDILDIVKDKK